jgi:chromosome segregation ATPase
LARAVTADLTRAAQINAQLKSDLDAALAALRQAADESHNQRAESTRLLADVESRAAQIRALREDLALLEAERDGALSQVARITRELREEKARSASAAEEAAAARGEAAQAREALQRIAAELRTRIGERDEARKELLVLRSERDKLASELLSAHAEAEALAQSRSALEEIHQALAEARARMSGIR